VKHTLLRALGASVLAAGLLTAAGCSPTGAPLDERLALQAKATLHALQTLPELTPHSGVRRIRSLRRTKTRINEVEYREDVRVASTGEYQVECIDVLASNFTRPDEFIALQNGRDGFVYRYRDFRIRDVDLLLANYVVTELGTPIAVAGRTCFTVALERRDDPRFDETIVTWLLAVDETSGLVLRWRRLADGVLTDEGEYESIAYGEPAAFAPHVPTNHELVFTPQTDLRRVFDFELTTPTLLPEYFERRQRASVVDATGQVWLKESFTDGIEVAFFLFHQDPPVPGLPTGTKPATLAPVSGRAPAPGAPAGSGGATVGAPPPPAAPTVDPRLLFVTHGDLVMAEYRDATRVGIVAGRLDEDDVQWMLESALN